MMAGPGNALAARRTAPMPTEAASPEAEMERLMRETGYDGNDPAEGMAHVWKAMPTDSVGELIEMLAKKHGLPTPFQDAANAKPEPYDGSGVVRDPASGLQPFTPLTSADRR